MNNGILLATQSGTINLNVDQKTLDMCIKATNNFGATIYHNICNGQEYTVAVGGWGQTFNILLAVGLVILILLMAKGLWRMFFDY